MCIYICVLIRYAFRKWTRISWHRVLCRSSWWASRRRSRPAADAYASRLTTRSTWCYSCSSFRWSLSGWYWSTCPRTYSERSTATCKTSSYHLKVTTSTYIAWTSLRNRPFRRDWRSRSRPSSNKQLKLRMPGVPTKRCRSTRSEKK